jgi:hypothetical protein
MDYQIVTPNWIPAIVLAGAVLAALYWPRLLGFDILLTVITTCLGL